jgi:tRNA threonylcarbamoyladenosine biosynthesis protein TsaB
MALILNIDTALEKAMISLADNGMVVSAKENSVQKDHAAWLHPAIEMLMNEQGKKFSELNAIAVNHGPGSYTGMRVGLAAAKGFCYSLSKPLIAVSSLEILATSAIKDMNNRNAEYPIGDEKKSVLIAPMIDARRMEVFTAIYDQQLKEIVQPGAMILDGGSFSEILKWQKILFLGNGSLKFQSVCQSSNALFFKLNLNASAMAELSYKSFIGNNFVGIAYAEPLYLKEFYTRQ